MILRRKARKGSVLAESAMIYPVLFMLILGAILLGVAVFRYQQVSHISREASRWASVHGAKYAEDPLNTDSSIVKAYNITPQGVFDNAAAPHAAGMPTQGMTFTATTNTTDNTITYTGVNQDGTLTFAITWNMDEDGNPDRRPTRVVQVVDSTGQIEDVARSNTATVTVTYTWSTGLFGTIPVSSRSVNTIFY